jgi:hypothetical protein
MLCAVMLYIKKTNKLVRQHVIKKSNQLIIICSFYNLLPVVYVSSDDLSHTLGQPRDVSCPQTSRINSVLAQMQPDTSYSLHNIWLYLTKLISLVENPYSKASEKTIIRTKKKSLFSHFDG